MEPNKIKEKLVLLRQNMARAIIGKPEVIKFAVVSLLARGHLLIEDVPGVGKTTLGNSLAQSLGLHFKRIQLTSDILPTDIIGVSIFDPKNGGFHFMKGPIFANIVLADEINRATPKSQSALLEAMNEMQVTVENTTHLLPSPFMLIATQNPFEFHGTFPLPESQLDRFMMRMRIGYPGVQEEKALFASIPEYGTPQKEIPSVLRAEEVLELQREVDRVTVADPLYDYLMAIITATRESKFLSLGVSPRGGLIYRQAAKALALVEGRDYCLPDDFKALAVPILAHRVNVAGRGMDSGDRRNAAAIIREIAESTPIPL